MTLITDQRHDHRFKPAVCIFGIALAAFGLLAGCNNNSQTTPPPSAAPKAATISVDPATAGNISGVVSFKSTLPKLKALDMTQDPGCPSSPQASDAVVVDNGKLANVFIYVKEGLPQGAFAVPSDPVVLDQKGCR